MILYKGNGRNGFPGFYKKFFLAIQNNSFETNCVCGFIVTNKFPPDFGIAVEIQGCCYNKSQYHLPEYFKPARQTVLITFFVVNSLLLGHSFGAQFQIIVDEP